VVPCFYMVADDMRNAVKAKVSAYLASD